MEDRTVATNRQARYLYDIIECYEAGIALTGPEVKSVRAGRVNLKDSFASVDENEELFLYNCHISTYEHTSSFKPDPKRKRKLLMRKAEIMRLLGRTTQKGLTLIPLKVYFKRGLCKIELALGKGRKRYDKRAKITEKEARREMRKISRGTDAELRRGTTRKWGEWHDEADSSRGIV